jgi:glycosyltransferase involved in cell wall biosynthesis
MSHVVFLYHGNIYAKTGASIYLRNLLTFKANRPWIISDRMGVHMDVGPESKKNSRVANLDSFAGNIVSDLLKILYRHVYGAFVACFNARLYIKNAQAIYCTDIWTCFIVSLFARNKGTVILAFHNSGVWSEMFLASYPRLGFARPLILYFERVVSKNTTTRIYLSNTALANSIKFNPSLKDNNVVLYNGIPDFKYEDLGEVEYDFVMIGTICGRKGQKYMIEALRVLSNSKKRCPKIAVIGGGPDRSELEKRVEEYSLGEHIHFFGPVENPWTIKTRFKALMFLSSIEGMPLVILEALRAGMPIFYYDLDVINEILDDNVAMKCDSVEPRKLSDSISEYMLLDKKLYPEMSNSCKDLFSDKFTLKRHLQALDEILKIK